MKLSARTMSPSSAVTSSAFVQSPQRTRMPPAKPSVAGSRHRIERRCRRFVRVRQPAVARCPGHDLLDLAEREAGEPEIEVEVVEGEQLLAQRAHVPAGILGNRVVRAQAREQLPALALAGECRVATIG